MVWFTCWHRCLSVCGFVYDSQGRRWFCLSMCGTHSPCRRCFSFCCFSASHGSCRSVANASCDHPSYYSAPPSASSPSTSSPPPPSPSSLSARTSPSAIMLARTCIGNRRQTVCPFFFPYHVVLARSSDSKAEGVKVVRACVHDFPTTLQETAERAEVAQPFYRLSKCDKHLR